MTVNNRVAETRGWNSETCPHCLKIFRRWSVATHISKGYCKEFKMKTPPFYRQNACIDSSIKKSGNTDKTTDIEHGVENQDLGDSFEGVSSGCVADGEGQTSVIDPDVEESGRHVTIYINRLYIYN